MNYILENDVKKYVIQRDSEDHLINRRNNKG